MAAWEPSGALQSQIVLRYVQAHLFAHKNIAMAKAAWLQERTNVAIMRHQRRKPGGNTTRGPPPQMLKAQVALMHVIPPGSHNASDPTGKKSNKITIKVPK